MFNPAPTPLVSNNSIIDIYYPEINAKTQKKEAATAPNPAALAPFADLSSVFRNVSTRYRLGVKHFDSNYKKGITPVCSPGYVRGACKDGHGYVQNLTCNREYCKDCGTDGSPVHQRRLERWMPKVRTMNKVAYLVVTIPEVIRYQFKDKKVLSAFRSALKNKLCRMGYKKGLARWHFYGDCKTCSGKGCLVCNQTGSGSVYHPHLNLLIEGGYIPDLKTSPFALELQHFLSGYFKKLHKTTLPVNWHYSYRRDEIAQAHAVKYITRATFRVYDHDTAKALWNFRNTTSWGKWEKEEVKESEALSAGLCIKCFAAGHKHKIYWTKKIDSKELKNKVQHIKKGTYYELTNPARGSGSETFRSDKSDLFSQELKKGTGQGDTAGLWGGGDDTAYRVRITNAAALN